MSQIEAFESEGELVVDSRLIAARLGIEHRSFLRTLRKFQAKIESRFGAVRFKNAPRGDGNNGGDQPIYALLNENQASSLMTFSRNTDEVVDCKLDLVEAFDKAKKVIKTIDLQAKPYWYRRLGLFRSKTKIPVGWWCIFEEIVSTIADLEELGYIPPEGIIPDVSVGKCWCNYLRDELKLNPKDIGRKYKHYYPDWVHPVSPYIYPLEYLPAFRIWFEEKYKPIKMVGYFRKVDPVALPSICKLLGLPEGK